MKRTSLSIVLAGCTLVGIVEAQQPADTVMLPGVVVTATRFPTSRELITARVVVISGDDLRAEGVTYIADALRRVAGVSVVQSGSFGSVTSMFMRGGESDYVQVLIDGVPVNQPGGAYNFADLAVVNVERVEILRGPASVLYGSDAVTGVIQIFTRDGSGPARAEASVRTGTYGTIDVAAMVSGGSPSASFSAEIRDVGTEGTLPFNNRYDNTSLSGRLTLTPDARTRATLSMRLTDSEFHFPTDGSGNLADSNQYSFDRVTTLGLDVSRWFASRLEGSLLLALNSSNGGGLDEPDHPADTNGVFASRSQRDLDRRSADGRMNFHLDENTVLTAGVAIEQQRERSVAEFQSSFGPFGNPVDVDRTNVGYYAQALTRLGGRVSVNLGARVDDNERFGLFLTGRGGVAVDIVAGTRVLGSVGNAFKEPTFIENYGGGFVVGNPDLEPERSLGWEVGVEQTLLSGRFVIVGTYFSQRFRDLIQYTGSPPNPGDPNFFNVAEADAAGIEPEARAMPLPGLILTGAYTYLSTEVIDSGFQGGQGATFSFGDRLLRRPAYTITAGARYRLPERGSLGAQLRYIGSRDDLDFSAFPFERVVLPAYVTVDLSANVVVLGRPSGRSVAVTLRVRNLLDKEYAEVFNFPAPRRTVMVGVKVGG